MSVIITYFLPGGYFTKTYQHLIGDILNIFCSSLLILSVYLYYIKFNAEYSIYALTGVILIYIFNFISLINLRSKRKDNQLYKSNSLQFNGLLQDYMKSGDLKKLYSDLEHLVNNAVHLHELTLFKFHISKMLNKKESSKKIKLMELTPSQKNLLRIIENINV